MKELSRHICIFFLAILGVCGFTSCVYDYYDDEEDPDVSLGTEYADRAFLALHVSPVDTRGATSGNVTERIKTLRVIVLNNKDGKDSVEYNKLISLGDLGFTPSYFTYDMMLPTIPGNKRLYFIANEKSVGSFMMDTNSSSSGELSAWLDSFQPKSADETFDQTAKNFENTINSIYFAPQYIANDGHIFLPYTSYYGNLNVDKGKVKEVTAYLVPVATKFTFKFINNRTYGVGVNEISLSKKNRDNFLFAHVGSSDSCKIFVDDNQSYYWVDWLAKVAEESHNHQSSVGDNELFNSKYGWIKDYSMPTTDYEDAKFLESLEPTVSGKTVTGVEGSPDYSETPGTLELGPFYVPESRYEIPFTDESGQTVTEQSYGLTLGLVDTKPNGKPAPTFENVTIDNLKALFRNTSVVITVVMSEGTIDAYAEINPWTQKTANGWVVEGEEPANNPYAPKENNQ